MRLDQHEGEGRPLPLTSSSAQDNEDDANSLLPHPMMDESNGFSKSAKRPGDSSNGLSHVNLVDAQYGTLPREEVVRLMIQAMTEMGYDNAAATLEQDSGYLFELPTISSFKKAVLTGNWQLVESTLDILVPAQVQGDEPENTINGDGQHSGDRSLQDIIAGAKARFLVREQKYLELLESKKIRNALHVLRKELAPIADWLSEDENVSGTRSAGRKTTTASILSRSLGEGSTSRLSATASEDSQMRDATARLHTLSCLLMCHDVTELKTRANWDGASGNSRHRLLYELSRFIPAAFMIPERRLQTLIEQSREYQAMLCPWHLSHTQFSLYEDHQCPAAVFPTKTVKILQGHTDEVWHVSWSSSGRYLATCGKDKTALIWDVATWTVLHKLTDHKHAVTYTEWSPDESMLLTCCLDKVVRLWGTTDGKCLTRLEGHKEQVGTAAWLPDGEAIVTGAMDRNVHFWGTNGRVVLTWKTCRVIDLAVSNDNKHLVVVGKEGKQGKIQFFNLEADKEIIVYENSDPTCVTISMDSKYALVSIAPSSLHLYSIEDGSLTQKYGGQQQYNLIIRSCFGGVGLDPGHGHGRYTNGNASNGSSSLTKTSSGASTRKHSIENFLLSGSEDGSVYVWHRESARLIEVLPGHTRSVNSVAWNWAFRFGSQASYSSYGTHTTNLSSHQSDDHAKNGNGKEISQSGLRPRGLPVEPTGVFASASDDGTVRIWGFPD